MYNFITGTMFGAQIFTIHGSAVNGVKMLFCRHCFSPLNTFMRKGKDPELDPDPSVPLTNGSGSGRPKNMWILRIRIRIPNTDNLVNVGAPNMVLQIIHLKRSAPYG
jgi:hypothetical protein